MSSSAREVYPGFDFLEISKEVFLMEYHLGKGVLIHLKPLCFWQIFHNLDIMFGSNPSHKVTLSHFFDVGPN